jgi:alpha-N-arabinofuranosidase
MNTSLGRRIARTAIACLALALCAAPAAAQNLVKNGDFARAGDPPPEWVKESEAARKGAVRVSGGVLELSPNRSNTPSAKPLGIGQAIDASAFAGRILSVSAKLGLRAPASGAVVGLHALRADGSEIGMVHLRQPDASGRLEEKTGTLAIPAGEKPKLLILFAVAEGLGGAALFGDIRVSPQAVTATRADAAPSAGPATAPAGPAYAATVSVNAASRGRAIPRDLFGVNIEWWRNANGLWDPAADRLVPDAVRLTKAVRPGLIRFPGGYLGDIYDWRQAMGPRKSRAKILTNPANNERDQPHFGTEELVDFARATGADLMLQANLGTGDARMAAEWVRHMKERARKDPKGPRATWWELGNELYHSGDASGVTLKPEAYADKYLAFARAMRAEDPAVRLGAIAMENYPLFPFNSYRNWNETVFRRAGAEIDFVAVHNGYAPVGPGDRANPREVYRALLAAPAMVAENLRTVGEQIRRNVPRDRADRVTIAVTEWAPLFHVTPASAWVDHSKTLGSALYVADVLRVFIADERVAAATFFKLNEPSFLGLLGMRRGEWIPNATYFAFQLYTEHFGTRVVASRRESPAFDSQQAGIVPAMKSIPLLESVASMSEDGERLYVMLVNKSLDQSADVSLSIQGFEPAGGKAHLLTGPSPDANTGAELPRIPGIRWAEQVNVDASARHFDRGSPAEVRLVTAPIAGAGRSFAYRLPPHSAASLELRRR